MEYKGLKLGTNLYIDLESIFDLRLSTIELLFPSTYEQIKKDALPYLGRMSDFINNIPKGYFKEVYRNFVDLGFMYILKHAKTTSILNIVNAELSILELKKIADVIEGKILNIHVNSYPFVLTEDEKKELISKLNSILISGNIEIDIVYKDTNLLNNKDLEMYDTVIMYNGWDWLNFTLLMDKYNVPQVKMYVPALITNGEVGIKNISDLEDYFNNISEMFKPIIDLTFLPAEIFSINPALLK